jgi:hypothetical protein
MEVPLEITGGAGEVEIEAVRAPFIVNGTAVDLPVSGGVNPSVTTAQYSVLEVGAVNEKVAEVPVTPVWGLEPEETVTTVVSDEQVLLVPL